MIVVDASALVEVLMGSKLGESVETRLADELLVAPEHIDVEVASDLARLERASILTDEDADKAMHRFAQLPLHRISHRRLALEAWQRRHSMRISDAFYIACALSIDAAILTLDQRLIRAAPAGVRFVPIGTAD